MTSLSAALDVGDGSIRELLLSLPRMQAGRIGAKSFFNERRSPSGGYTDSGDEPRPSTQAATALANIMTVALLALSTKVLAWENRWDEE